MQAARIRGAAANSCSNWGEARDNSSRIAIKQRQWTAIHRAAPFRPGHDHLVADIAEHFAATNPRPASVSN